MKRIAVFAGLLVPMLALAGCETAYTPEAIEPAQPASQSIDGSWVDQNGIVSSFSNGNFETRTTDTNQVLATGTYTYASDNLVTMRTQSNVRASSTFNCAIVNPTQMNCTSSTGTQFTMMRTNAPMPAG